MAAAAAERLGPLALIAIGLVWLPVAYFPHSNIPVLLPTIRAERFWYLPAFGSACMLAVLFTRLIRRRYKWGPLAIGVFLGFQALAARWHAFDYTDDLIFWRATHNAAPRSAKAQLNYSVMLGARGQLDERLKVNAEAMRLAPNWPMAHVYYGDTLCRLKRAEEAWPHYVHGFELAPNDLNLIALGLQCAWEEKIIDRHKDELLALSEKYPGSWLAFLGSDLVYNGVANGGVQKKYRPRAYDEGPKSDAP
jgi:protein O-mannosyl-transferase